MLKGDGIVLEPFEALKLLLSGEKLITSSRKIAEIHQLEDEKVFLKLTPQVDWMRLEYSELSNINHISFFRIKRFDFRKEMIARPDEWVGKKDIDGTEYYFGFNTVYMRVVGTSNEEAKKRKIDLGNNNHFYMRDVEGMEEI